MSTTDDGLNLDPATVDLDAWIDDVQRPEVTVELYPREVAFRERLAELEAQVDAIDDDADRGLDDPSTATILAKIDELRAERAASTLRVRLRQPLQEEFVDAAVRAKRAKVPERDWVFWQIATACVEPAFTPEQLRRLSRRDRSGEAMWAQLVNAVQGLLKGLPVPS